MKTNRNEKPVFFKSVVVIIFLITVIHGHSFAQCDMNTDTAQQNRNNYLATSVFILTSFIPDDDTYFFELDYGHKLRDNMDIIFGLNIYKYAAPMSTPMNDNTKYPGTVTSYGIVAAFQYYPLKNIFIDQMINPLLLNYKHLQEYENGFMLLLATRLGYHYDFNMFNNPFFFEIGAEVSYWPVNTNVPEDYKSIDNSYKSFVFSPAFQFGYKF